MISARADYVGITDDEALEAFQLCTRMEGNHSGPGMRPRALAHIAKLAPTLGQRPDHPAEFVGARRQGCADGGGTSGCRFVSRIASRFAALRAEGRGALIPFLEAYDPDLATSTAILAGMPARARI